MSGNVFVIGDIHCMKENIHHSNTDSCLLAVIFQGLTPVQICRTPLDSNGCNKLVVLCYSRAYSCSNNLNSWLP